MSKKLLSCFGRRKDNTRREMASVEFPPYSGQRERHPQKPSLVSQFAKEVTDFSSQYGSETSISYTACNLAGRSNIYPTYGDFTQACVFRTYGPWWNIVPSSKRKFNKRPSDFCSEDFIEVLFDIEVYPCKVEIWETYNPGAIVKILACDSATGTDVDSGKTRWQTLWKAGEPEGAPAKSRIFSPPLNNPQFKTKLIRLELSSRKCHYYTELDCVVMYGSLHPYLDMEQLSIIQQQMDEFKDYSEPDNYVYMVTSLMNKLSVDADGQGEPLEIGNQIWDDKEERIPIVEAKEGGDDERETTQVVQADNREKTSEESGAVDNGYFDLLPGEVIQLILSYLDLLSLTRICQTCSLLQKHCSDSLQHTELNLQPYWHKVDSAVMESFQSVCGHLQHLNLSWCGGSSSTVSTSAFDRFLSVCGKELTTLYLGSCNFVNAEVMKSIAEYCPKLKDLDVQSCPKIDSTGILHLLKLRSITRLNLYRTLVDIHSLICLIRVFENLEVLNLGSCSRINNFDDVCKVLGEHCKKLCSLDLWRSRSLTSVGLKELASGCPELEELDIGWCPELRSGSESVTYLAQKCRKLKKLFLTANRNVCDADLVAISKYCHNLQQLDILGTREVSKEAVLGVLQSCPDMVMFDVSFCASIDFPCVEAWSKEFPNVNIKKSFQH